MTSVAEGQESNREIVRLLAEMIEKHADQRFGQIPVNSGVLQLKTEQSLAEERRALDPFYEESSQTLRRVLKTRQAPQDLR